jgi:hypothetical protein
MLTSLNPFCCDRAGLDPGWLDPGAGGFVIYAGQGSPGRINWDDPVGFAQAQGHSVSISLPPGSPGRICLAAHAVSAGGVEENSASAILWLDVDASGSVAPAMAPVTDLVAQPIGNGQVLLNFACGAAAGMLTPDTFDILGNTSASPGGTGQLDVANPIATISDFPAGQEQYECVLATASLPATLAVRPSASGVAGPISASVIIYGAGLPTPQLLQT